MNRFLSVFFLSKPILAANARGEGFLNTLTLQKISSLEGTRTVINGVAIRYAMRSFMEASGAEMFRHHDDGEGSRSGFSYGPDRVASKEQCIPESQGQYADLALFGDMMTPKNTEAHVYRSPLSMSPAISTTPYNNDTYYMRGLKPDGQTNPVTGERHFTRYQLAFSIDLGRVKDIGGQAMEGVRLVLESLLGLQIGGSHSSNASELVPEVLAWRFHNRPGLGGMYVPNLNVPVEGEMNLKGLEDQASNLGFEYLFAGTGSTLSVRQGVDTIWKEAQGEVSS